MKTLIADDDLVCRQVLRGFLQQYGVIHFAVNGREAVEAARLGLEANEPYDLICLDIMMPEMNGQEALAKIRLLEAAHVSVGQGGAKIVMITSLADAASVLRAARLRCDSYLSKPYQRSKLLVELHRLKLIDSADSSDAPDKRAASPTNGNQIKTPSTPCEY